MNRRNKRANEANYKRLSGEERDRYLSDAPMDQCEKLEKFKVRNPASLSVYSASDRAESDNFASSHN